MTNKTWKAHERAVAKRVGGRRIGPTGRQGPDVVSAWLSIECKSRKALPAWLVNALQQARSGASETHLPLVILHQVGARHDDDLCVLSLADFTRWFGELEGGE